MSNGVSWNDNNEYSWTSCSINDSNYGLGAKVNITFSTANIDELIGKAEPFGCPKNCPLKRDNKCLSSKCIRAYPEMNKRVPSA